MNSINDGLLIIGFILVLWFIFSKALDASCNQASKLWYFVLLFVVFLIIVSAIESAERERLAYHADCEQQTGDLK